MTSKSRAAQEQLAELEKASAPFEDQLLEASKFIGVDLDTVGRPAEAGLAKKQVGKSVISHGREEWLLRWLLKKLTAPKDDVPRQQPGSWWLFGHLIQAIPFPIVAKLLTEKKFTNILRQTLEGAQKILSATTANVEVDNSKLAAVGGEEKTSKKSKKRKRSPELVQNATEIESLGLLNAIHGALEFMVNAAEGVIGQLDGDDNVAFSAECMKSAMRTSAQESAVILGLWFSSSSQLLKSITNSGTWLTPSIGLWQARTTEESDLLLFSQHCTQQLLQLLLIVKKENPTGLGWIVQLELLLARNIMIPAKAAHIEEENSNLLQTLTRISVIRDPANAPLFFDIAIRSIQTSVSRRRRPQDDAWLQTVFNTLIDEDTLLPRRQEENSRSLHAMLQSAITFKVQLDLETLRRITSKFALPEDRSDWKIVAALIKLDGNVFLIPDSEKDLLSELFARITKVSVQSEWVSLADEIVVDILVPLMGEFVKARDLSGFIHYWYAQLVEFEKLRRNAAVAIEVFGPWEDDALQEEFGKMMEPSLTIPQINRILDWLSEQAEESPDAVCVILQAIAGSISREEVVDSVNLRLYHLIFDDGVSEKLSERYAWRSWVVLSRTLNWVMGSGLDELELLQQNKARPFEALLEITTTTSLDASGKKIVGFGPLEMLRCACALWTAAGSGSQLETSLKPMMRRFLNILHLDLKTFIQDLLGDSEIGEAVCDSRQNALHRDSGLHMWSCVRCVFVEYPKALQLAPEIYGVDSFKEMLKDVFWICAASGRDIDSNPAIKWLHINPEAFPNLWAAALKTEIILNSLIVTETMIDIMLRCDSNMENPLIKSDSLNTFAISCLLQLPLELFSKRNREAIMTKWELASQMASETDNPSIRFAPLDPAVLSLKIKMMRRPTFYENMNFNDLIKLANSFADKEIPSPKISLSLFREYVRLMVCQMTESMDQLRNKTYITDALSHIKKGLKSGESKKKEKQITYSLTTLFDVTLAVLKSKSVSLENLGIISTMKFQKLLVTFKGSLLSQMQDLIGKVAKENSRGSSKVRHSLTLVSALQALTTLGVAPSELGGFIENANELIASGSNASNTGLEVERRLETFIATHCEGFNHNNANTEGNISTIYGRLSISEKTHAAINGKDQEAKLLLLKLLLSEENTSLTQLDKLLAARHVIISCDDTRKVSEEDDHDDDDDDALSTVFNLSDVYTLLCLSLYKSAGIRQFCLISETMELMLRTKGRSVSQWNIDSTLGSITTICSRNGPALRSERAGTIFLHLCRLLQAVLISHRLKLQGHFHLVVQVMQTLLRCLFVPLPHSTTKTTKFMVPPPWLSSPKHQLKAKHGTAYARIITLICDPSVSSVTRSQHNSLTSAVNKAKGMAAQHMQFLLGTYIKLQLEMRMLPEIREKMVPALYTIFDTTNPEMRRMINESLDSSGRSVFGTLFRDYQRFGQWGGS